MPENLDKNKDITSHISTVLKRSFYCTIAPKQFKEYYKSEIIHHIQTKDLQQMIVSYTGKVTFNG